MVAFPHDRRLWLRDTTNLLIEHGKEQNGFMLGEAELNDLEDDYWICHMIPTTTVTRAVALAQLKKVVEWLQPYTEENYNQVTVTLSKQEWNTLRETVGL